MYNNIEQKAANKTILKKNKSKRVKWLSERTLKTAEERSEEKGRKGKYTQSNAEFQKQHKGTRRPSSVNSV